MIIKFHKKFSKKLKKLPKKVQEQFYEKLAIFEVDLFANILNNHAVHYPYDGCRSINITGDFRALYEISGATFTFIHVGTHSELYK